MNEFEETEKRVLCCLRSLRNIETIAGSFGLTREQFITKLKGKTVIDIGSGIGGFAIDAILRNVDCTVYSVDPCITDPDFEKSQRESLTKDRNKLFSEFSPLEIEHARTESLKSAYPHFAHRMPSFKRGQFDLLVDHYAVFGYFLSEEELPALLRTISEERRVLKTGSPMYIADFVPYKQNPILWGNWKELQLAELGLKYRLAGNSCSIIIRNRVQST